MSKYIKDPMSSLTHFIGIILSIIGLFFLISKAQESGNTIAVIAFVIFGISLILLYTASTVYHAIISPKWLSKLLHRIDHMMIFVLIAGTYTPICLISLNNKTGLIILTLIWTLAALGIIFKIFWMNAPRWLGTSIYLVMGWIIIIAIYPLYKSLNINAITWLVLGGLSYTIGAIIYGTKKTLIHFKNFGFHEVFHIFVLLGSFCHFTMIYRYVINF